MKMKRSDKIFHRGHQISHSLSTQLRAKHKIMIERCTFSRKSLHATSPVKCKLQRDTGAHSICRTSTLSYPGVINTVIKLAPPPFTLSNFFDEASPPQYTPESPSPFNSAHSLRRDTFVNLPSMKILLLNRNNISTLHDKAFKELTSLEELELSTNQIKVITGDSFHGLRNLVRLDLRNNLIAMVGDKTFIEMPSLRELELDQNEIEYISEKALDGMRNLRKLRLSDNRLISLEPDFLAGAPSVYFLDLRDNELKTMTFDNIKPIVTNLYNSSSHFYLNGESISCMLVAIVALWWWVRYLRIAGLFSAGASHAPASPPPPPTGHCSRSGPTLSRRRVTLGGSSPSTVPFPSDGSGSGGSRKARVP